MQPNSRGKDATTESGKASLVDVMIAMNRYTIEIDSGLTMNARLEIERVLRECGAKYKIRRVD